MIFDDDYLERYSRQILLPEISLRGQERLQNSHALLIGVGGLGCPAAIYLACSGVGELTLCDHDLVETSNLGRQILHTDQDVGRAKVHSARDHLHGLNPEIRITTIARRLEATELHRLCASVDVVLDGSDNFATRFLVNRACLATGTPLVSGAVIRFEGQLAVFRHDLAGRPCLHCLYPEGIASADRETCSESGVFAPAAGMIGSAMAAEAIKLLLGIGQESDTVLSRLDGLALEWRRAKVLRDPLCPDCAARSEARQETPSRPEPRGKVSIETMG